MNKPLGSRIQNMTSQSQFVFVRRRKKLRERFVVRIFIKCTC